MTYFKEKNYEKENFRTKIYESEGREEGGQFTSKQR